MTRTAWCAIPRNERAWPAGSPRPRRKAWFGHAKHIVAWARSFAIVDFWWKRRNEQPMNTRDFVQLALLALGGEVQGRSKLQKPSISLASDGRAGRAGLSASLLWAAIGAC